MFIVETIKRVTVAEQVMEQIAQLIISGQLKPGEQLPNERDLAVMFGVTRGRIREALRALSLVGLITIKAGEGSFVNKQEVPIPADTIVWMFHNERNNLEEIYAARKLIESEIYRLATQYAEADDILKLKGYIEELAKLKEDQVEEFLEILEQFDMYMGQLSQNKIYDKLMQTIIYLRRDSSRKILCVPGAMENSIKTRNDLIQAIESGDPKRIKSSIGQLFKSAQKFYDSIISS
ncbi:FadR/GntR family transcriptional regulator [Brevibacillus sp. TJ4]|uniref:FadR/GntR family transcriptional regulator n=1 Tax=Brevibacillus sp. TJ4 TaxID=3234853 RepID=UPI0037D20484